MPALASRATLAIDGWCNPRVTNWTSQRDVGGGVSIDSMPNPIRRAHRRKHCSHTTAHRANNQRPPRRAAGCPGTAQRHASSGQPRSPDNRLTSRRRTLSTRREHVIVWVLRGSAAIYERTFHGVCASESLSSFRGYSVQSLFHFMVALSRLSSRVKVTRCPDESPWLGRELAARKMASDGSRERMGIA